MNVNYQVYKLQERKRENESETENALHNFNYSFQTLPLVPTYISPEVTYQNWVIDRMLLVFINIYRNSHF